MIWLLVWYAIGCGMGITRSLYRAHHPVVEHTPIYWVGTAIENWVVLVVTIYAICNWT